MNKQTSSLRCFTRRDAVPNALEGERVAVLGYGHLGRPFAQNLRDSGVTSLVIGNTSDHYANQAKADQFLVLPITEATAQASIILALLPDEVISEVFAAEILPHLRQDAAIVFASGYSLAYGHIQPPSGVDVLMLAPRMAGENARQRFLQGQGFYAYVSVEQDASGKAWQRLLGLADATGVLQAGALELSASQEADLDLLIEQTVGAALGAALMHAFALGVEYGIPEEAMVLEMYMSGEMETVWRGFRELGFFRSANDHGPTAMYGGFIRTMPFLTSDMAATFRKTMEEIHSGQFAAQFQAERKAGYPLLSQAQLMSLDDSPMSLAEKRLREMLPSE